MTKEERKKGALEYLLRICELDDKYTIQGLSDDECLELLRKEEGIPEECQEELEKLVEAYGRMVADFNADESEETREAIDRWHRAIEAREQRKEIWKKWLEEDADACIRPI